MAHESGVGTAPALGNDSGAIVWRHPNLDIEVYVQPLPAGLIPERAQQGLKAKPPSEVGGLLLGGIFSNGRIRTFLVTAAEFISSEGASSNPARLDFGSLLAAAKQYKSAGNIRPIGYFRSNLRESFTLTEEDLTLMRQCFPTGECVALLIRPDKDGACMARFFLSENGSVQKESSERDESVPGAEPELAAKEPAARAEAPPPEHSSLHNVKRSDMVEAAPASPFLVREQTTAPGPLSLPDPRTAPGPGTQNQAKFLAALLCIALAAGGLYLYTRSQASRRTFSSYAGRTQPPLADGKPPDAARAAAPGLGLEVTRPMPGELDVTWNRDLLADATGGQFRIVDGAIHRTVVLDDVQLREGKLSYFPRNRDVLFKLDVELPEGRSVSESLRVVGSDVITARNSMPVPIAKSPVQAPGAAAATAGNGVGVTSAANSTTPASQQTSAPAAGTPPILPGVDTTSTTDIAPAEVLSGNLHLPVLQEAPKTIAPEPSKPAALSGPVAQVPAVPAPQANAPGDERNDAKPAPLQARYLEPKPLRQVMPNIRSIMPAGVTETVRVEIGVQVDKNGRVTGARLRTPQNLLTGACLVAAREWTFTPAKLNNDKVGSDYVITFLFQPQHYER